MKSNVLFRFYRVLVMMVDDTVKNPAEILNTDEAKTYKQWKTDGYKVGVPYVAFAFKGDSYEENKNLIIGNEKTFDNRHKRRKKRDESNLTNGKLVPNKEYVVAVRGYTEKVRKVLFLTVEDVSFVIKALSFMANSLSVYHLLIGEQGLFDIFLTLHEQSPERSGFMHGYTHARSDYLGSCMLSWFLQKLLVYHYAF
jgi:hypothetical protein